MKFAHISQIFSREGETAAERYDLLWRELALCDELNYDFGFTTVHHFSHLRPQVTVFCTGAAARTSRIRLGPIGYTVALHEPIRVVEEVAVLDNITNGRLEIGLTAGVTYDEFRIYGADWDNRHARATEMMYLLKKAFTSEKPLDFEGSFNRYEQVQLSVEPLQKPHPPIWLISLSPDQIKASAKEGVHTGYAHFRPRHEAVPPIKDYLRMWRENGHPYDPNICYMTFVYVDETDEAAAAKAGPNILHSTDAIYGGELGEGASRSQTFSKSRDTWREQRSEGTCTTSITNPSAIWYSWVPLTR